MKKFFTTAMIAVALIACNSNQDKPVSTETSHDAHSTTSSTIQMPAMPEVPANARVYFVNLKDGQQVSSPLKVDMGVEAMTVDTANGIIKPASGHHHILVDIDSIPTGTIVPPTDSLQHYHFGKAQTSGEIKLAPGKHTIVLQFADALHRSYGSRLTSRITVNVKQ
jgi:hypothetical protein